MSLEEIADIKSALRRKLCRLSRDFEVGSRSVTDIMDEAHDAIYMVCQLSQLLVTEDPEVEHCLTVCNEILQLFSGSSFGTEIPLEVASASDGRRSVGRPKFDIPTDFLMFMLESHFTVPKIATMLGVSESTVKRRMRDSELTVSSFYTDITEEDLRSEVISISENFPGAGYRSVKGHLLAKGIRVTEPRIRSMLRRVDPEGSLLRRVRLTVTSRRKYSVRGPLALWHIDGYHKLIRWGIVVHGGIDGYSRIPVYLRASDNNRAASVMEAFEQAVEKWGLPERVRSDKGGENVKVAAYMLRTRNPADTPFIAGRSVHNQRIERLWRDLWTGCISVFYQLFFHMEEIQLLDMTNELDVFSLRYVFIPRIQAHLDQFVEAFIQRPMRTERNQSPWQLWIGGLLEDARRSTTPLMSFVEVEAYGIDFEEDGNAENIIAEEVEVPPLSLSVPEAQTVATVVNPLEPSSNFGIDVYQAVKSLLRNHFS